MGWSYVSSDEIQGYVADSFLSKNKLVYDDYYTMMTSIIIKKTSIITASKTVQN